MSTFESSPSSASASSSKARTCADGLSVAGWVVAAFALALCTPPFEQIADSVFLVGSVAIAPAGYVFAGVLACTAIALSIASTVVRVRVRARSRAGAVVAEGRGRRAVRWVVNGIMGCALAVTLFISGFQCLLAVPYVADPPSPAGDRVVVVERNVLLSGNGTVYLVPNGFGFGVAIARYAADDGYSPMGNGMYTLEWHGRTPAFEAMGTPFNPVNMYPPE